MNMKIPAIGTLRDRLQLLAKNISQDDAGGHIINYQPIANVWAKVTLQNAKEIEQIDANSVASNFIILIRFRNDLSIGDKVIYQTRELEIISISDLNNKRAYLKLICSEIRIKG